VGKDAENATKGLFLNRFISVSGAVSTIFVPDVFMPLFPFQSRYGENITNQKSNKSFQQVDVNGDNVFEEISSMLCDYFLPIVFGVILLIFVVALVNGKKLATKEYMSFKVYKQDWQRSHMYQERIDEDVRSGFNKWLKFNFLLGKCLAMMGFTPNLASGLAFVLSTAGAYYFIKASSAIPLNLFLSDLYFALAVAFLLLSGLLDVLDGAIARLTYSGTSFGDLIDNVLDKYSDAIVLIAIIYAGLVNAFVGLAALLGSLLVDYTRARTIGLGLKRTKVTIGERPFRMLMISAAVAFQFVAQLSAALNIRVPIGEGAYLYEPFLNSVGWGILVLAILTHFSTLQIVMHAKKSLSRESL
jgi:archaetidylinositol phosphate synthase